MRTVGLNVLFCSAAISATVFQVQMASAQSADRGGQAATSASGVPQGVAQATASQPIRAPAASSSQVVATGQQTGEAASTGSVAEIVVTAQKRQERVQDVPVAVTVVGADQLARQQITQLTDLSRSVPSLEFGAPGGISPGGGGIIRGIGTVAFSESAEPSVGVVVDGVTQFNANVSDLFDIARVEVLEGPQGTLFGQSVSAGVINISTPTPNPNEFSGHISTQLSGNGFAGSNYGRQIVQGVVNIPISSDSALRIAAHEDHFNDIQNNSYLNKADYTNDYGIRARYFWDPSSKLQLNVIADYNNSRTGNGDYLTYRSVPANSVLANDLAACGVTPGPNNFTTCGSVPDTTRTTTYGLSAQVDYEVAGQTLTSISSYRKRILRSQDDVDGFPFGAVSIPLDIGNGPSERNSDYFTQELRIASPSGSRIEYTLGGFYSNYGSTYTNPSSLILNFGGPPASTTYTELTKTYISSYALFGQLTFHLTDHLRLITGGRLTRDMVRESHLDPSETPDFAADHDTVNNASWKLGVQYDLNRNLMVYATDSRGFKGPQINDGTTSTGTTIVKPEIPQNYEIGLKSTVLNGRLAADFGLFYDTVNNFQSQVCTANITNLGVDTGELCNPSNISKVVTKGVEANIFGQPVQGLTVNAGFIYNPAAFPKGYIATDGTNVGGEQLTYTSKTKITLSGNYEHPVTEKLDGFVSFDAVYHSQTYLYTSADPNFLYSSYWTLGGQLGVRTHAGWKLSIFGRNLLNNAVPAIIYPSQYAGVVGSSPAYQQYMTAASKRTVGLGLDISF